LAVIAVSGWLTGVQIQGQFPRQVRLQQQHEALMRLH
jgi:hypothetical protein